MQQQAEEEDDLYDHSGEAFLQEQLEEEAAEGSAELRRSSSKGAAAPASRLVGAEPRIPRVQQGVRSNASVRVYFRGQMAPRARAACGAMAAPLTVTYDLLDSFNMGES